MIPDRRMKKEVEKKKKKGEFEEGIVEKTLFNQSTWYHTP